MQSVVIDGGFVFLYLQILDPELEIADHAFPPQSVQPSTSKIQVRKTVDICKLAG